MEVEERSAAIGALSLTAREIEYISLAAIGFKNIEIADILSVTNSTVKKTLEEIYRKLNAKDRANAVSIAYQHKIITGQIIAKIIFKYQIIIN